jgi:hypothetical protein
VLWFSLVGLPAQICVALPRILDTNEAVPGHGDTADTVGLGQCGAGLQAEERSCQGRHKLKQGKRVGLPMAPCRKQHRDGVGAEQNPS